jgi:hypothetical protein
MTVLLENPIAIAVIGGLLGLVGLVVFLSRRTLGAMIALGGILGATALLLVLERLVVTEPEAVENGVDAVLAAIELNDMDGVLEWIDPAATGMRANVQALMPIVKVSNANAAAVQVDVTPAANPPTAKAQFQAYLQGVHTSTGHSLIYVNQQVDMQWIKRGDRWLLQDYTAYYDGQPIDAVGSARGNRALPTR